MRRVLILPAVAATAALVGLGYATGYLWPILTTARSVLRREPCNEADYLA